MKDIIKRFCKYYQKYNIYAKYENASEHILDAATFDDVDYTCESRSDWSLAKHLHYAAALALQYDRTGEKRYAELSNLALAHWAANDYRNSNWWHNDIGTPRLLMHTALFLGDALETENLNYVLSRLPDTVEERWTGANKSWLAENVICKGLLLGNTAMVREGSDIIKSTIFISKRGIEGIQKDYSFTQHGAQLYNHGYGLSFINNVTTWGYILFGSQFAFSDEEVTVVTNLCLNGTYRMCRKGSMDFQPRSREIVRGIIGQPGHMDVHIPALEILLDLNEDEERKEKLLQVYDHITIGKRMPLLEGNNMYWCVDYMTHVKERYYASVRWASKGVLGGDVEHGVPVNRENLLAGFAAYGGTCYMVSGKEYENIPPVWDWGLLPGTTTPHVEMPIEIGGFHESTFVGGVTNGKCGVIAADMHKSYDFEENACFGGKCASFMFENVIVHLGKSFYTDSKHDFNTCYNQCLLNGAVYADGNVVKGEGFTAKNVRSVYHDNIAYYNLSDVSLTLEAGAKTGDWRRVYDASNVSYAPVSKEVFLLYQPQCKKNGCYAYAVVPGIDVTEYKEFNINEQIEVYSENDILAVYNYADCVYCAVFFKAGECVCNDVKISTDVPCIVLYDFNTNIAYISTPVPEIKSVRLTVGDSVKDICVNADVDSVGKTVSCKF